jgi:hypothetical protein
LRLRRHQTPAATFLILGELDDTHGEGKGDDVDDDDDNDYFLTTYSAENDITS